MVRRAQALSLATGTQRPVDRDGRLSLAALGAEHAEVAAMRATYRDRRDVFAAALAGVPQLAVTVPAAGIFCLLDVRGSGLYGEAFADALPAAERVSVLPGRAFAPSPGTFVRVSLCASAERLREAARRLARSAASRAAPARVAP